MSRRLASAGIKARSVLEEELYKLEALVSYNIDVNSRRIYLIDDIEAEAIAAVIKNLHFLELKNEDPISIYISSQGGSLDLMFLLYDAIQNSPCEITTIGSGEICSAAVLLLACGHRRLCTQTAWLMAHQSWSSVSGSQTEIQAQAEAHKKMEAKMWELLAKHSKKTAVEWKARAKEQGEIWLSPAEMVEYGVVDSVIKPTRPNPVVSKTTSKKKTNGK